MDEAGGLLLLLKEVIDREFQGINNKEASKKIETIRKEIELLFYNFEKLNPPSKCISLKQEILNIMVNMQEIVVTDYESLFAAENGLKGLSQDKLDQSRDQLEKFRKNFHDTTQRVNILLAETKKR